MKIFRVKFFLSVFVIILLLLGFSFYSEYRDNTNRLFQEYLNKFQPCQKPITYSIVSIDPRFGLTKEELLDDIKRVEMTWESPVNKQLFEYSSTGDLKINLIYDYRQKATDDLKKIGIVIDDSQATYKALKSKYDALIVLYNQEKEKIEALIAAYNIDKGVYEKDVKYWNSHGKTSKIEYDKLEQKRINLNNQITIINQAKDSLNRLVETINSAELVLNKLAGTLNLQVNTYNAVGSSAGKEFKEGEYISDTSGTMINIFQYNNTDQLVRVLAHEFGHALGLEHLDNPKAIMYYLNEGINEKITEDDLVALKSICGIE